MNLSCGLKGSSSGARLSMMIGSSGSMCGDSNNSSEDLSGSLSSTAASVAKLKFETEFTQENGKVCNPKEKSSCSDTVPVDEHRKGGVARSKKKHRGETVEPEKDHSYTNLGSSSAAFMGVRNSPEMSSRQRHNEVNCDRPLPSEEVRIEDASQYDLAANLSWKPKEKGEHKESESRQQQPTGCDPLVGSIVLLQAVQEALAKEIEHFREIGNNQITLFNESRRVVSLNTKICSVDQAIHVGHCLDQKIFSGLEDMEMSSKVNASQRKLEETLSMLDFTESKIAELERILSKNDWVKEESAGSRSRSSISSGKSLQYVKDKSTKMENEIKTLLKKKVEAEKRYYQQLDGLRKTMGSKKQSRSKLVGSEKEGVLLLNAEKEEELMLKDKEKLLKMKDSITKYGFCLVVQLMFFLIVLVFWMSNLPQQSVGPTYVPT
ncbi:hypothetical protein MKW92_032161 [Papaver armeniacum]|nr:hypothetical protein MKW92_032161 [Papaver armeniacum]